MSQPLREASSSFWGACAAVGLVVFLAACASPPTEESPPPTDQAPTPQPTATDVGLAGDAGVLRTPVLRTPGAQLLISVIDEHGERITDGVLAVSTEFEGSWSYYDSKYSVDVATIQDGLLSVSPPPRSYRATMSFRVVMPDGRTSDTLLIQNDEYWVAVVATSREFVAIHRFDLAKSGVSSDAVYLGSP